VGLPARHARQPLPDLNPRRVDATTHRTRGAVAHPAHWPRELTNVSRHAPRPRTNATVPVALTAAVHFVPIAPPAYTLAPLPEHFRGVALRGR